MSYLIAIGADNEQGVRTKAAQRLEEIDSKYPGFVQVISTPILTSKFTCIITGRVYQGLIRRYTDLGAQLL